MNIFFIPQSDTYLLSKFHSFVFIPSNLLARIFVITITVFCTRKITDCPRTILTHTRIGIVSLLVLGIFEFVYYFIYNPANSTIATGNNVVPISIIGLVIAVLFNTLLLLDHLRIIVGTDGKVARVKYQASPISVNDMDYIIQRMNEIMKRNLLYKDPDLTIDDIARQLKVPKMYISQILNKKLGTNFYEYVNRYRIDAAIEYMNNSNDATSILDLALIVGFNSLSSFYKYFKKQTGVSPKKYKGQSALSVNDV